MRIIGYLGSIREDPAIQWLRNNFRDTTYRFNSNGTIDAIVDGGVMASADYSTDGIVMYIGPPQEPFVVSVFTVVGTNLYLFDWTGDSVRISKFLKS